MELLGEDSEQVRSGVIAFDRVVILCKVDKETPALRLAKAVAEAYENVNFHKMAAFEAGINELCELRPPMPVKPLRIRTASQLED